MRRWHRLEVRKPQRRPGASPSQQPLSCDAPVRRDSAIRWGSLLNDDLPLSCGSVIRRSPAMRYGSSLNRGSAIKRDSTIRCGLLYSRGSVAALALLALLLTGCLPWARRSAGPPPGLQGNREDPALSGDGRLLASVVERGGRATLLLQEQPSGRLLPLPQLGRLQPHRSPSLSWNGRYVALLGQEGDRSQPLVLDRLTGQLRRLLTPPGLEPQRLSLSPDGQRLALQLLQQGRSLVQVFDLSGLLEPDRPPGQPERGGGAP